MVLNNGKTVRPFHRCIIGQQWVQTCVALDDAFRRRPSPRSESFHPLFTSSVTSPRSNHTKFKDGRSHAHCLAVPSVSGHLVVLPSGLLRRTCSSTSLTITSYHEPRCSLRFTFSDAIENG